MKSSLSTIDRFMYGNADIVYGDTVGFNTQDRVKREFLEESPKRQRALITLAKKQIDSQEEAARTIAASNIAGAQMVSAQIQQQTHQLQHAFEQVGAMLSNEIASAADQISYTVEALGATLSMELAEIQWQMAQQNKTLERILHVLQENRNNETRQLVSQGIRLYLNQQYDKAEERFRRALDYDMTDYQVLMNLAYIEIHKEHVKDAFSYFNDAISLPEQIDEQSKSRTLWAISRLHYTQKNYEKALYYADESLKLESQANARHLFLSGSYAALAGKKQIALQKIEQAIRMDASLFAIAAVEPDLEAIRQDVLTLLGSLSQNLLQMATNLSGEIQGLLSKVEQNNGHADYREWVASLRTNADTPQGLLRQPTYSNCVEYLRRVTPCKNKLQKAQDIIPQIDAAQSDIDRLLTKKDEINRELSQKKYQHQTIQPQANSVGIPLWAFILAYCIPPILQFTINFNYVQGVIREFGSGEVVFFMLFLWPLGMLEMLNISKHGSAGIIIFIFGIIISVIMLAYLKQRNSSFEEQTKSLQWKISSLQDSLKQVEQDMAKRQDAISRLTQELRA